MPDTRAANPPRGTLRDLNAPESLATYLARLWAVRGFILAKAWGDVASENRSTFLGGLWLVLNPLAFATIYYFVFGVLFQTSRGVGNFPAFLVAGLFTFQFTIRSITSGARSISSGAALIQSLRFPRAALPVATTLAAAIEHLPGLLVMWLVGLATSTPPTWTWLLLIPAALVQTVFNLGLAMAVARLTFKVPDVLNALPHLLRFWLYLSGVVFPASLVAERAGALAFDIFEANPMHLFLTIVRDALLDGTLTGSTWAFALLAAALSLSIGLRTFRAAEHDYANAKR